MAVPVGYSFVSYFNYITTFKALDHRTYIGQVSFTLHTCKYMNVGYICEVHINPTFIKVMIQHFKRSDAIKIHDNF